MSRNSGKKQRLELTWVGKDQQPKLEPRILIEDPEKSYGDKNTENMLIFGDNLLALKALEQDYAGKIKCIFIDPPYNTGSAFTHYNDGLEHSIWLGLMRDRLEILRKLLSEDGSLWVTLDDNESHYFKVMADEVFGRNNFVANVIWQKVYSERMDARGFSNSHDHLMVFRKSPSFQPIQLAKEQNSKQFNFFDEKKQKFYRRRSLRKEGSESLRSDRPSMWYAIQAPDGADIYPLKPDGTEGRWRWKKENVKENISDLDFVKKGSVWEIYVKQFIEAEATRPPATIWLNDEVGHNHEAKLEAKQFNSVEVFDTPKPERLLKRVLEIATQAGDFVLDSFAGSGTTGAVAHKMGRQWIMVELGEHCDTHIVPRLQKVIDGSDLGGISTTAKTEATIKLCKSCKENLCEKCAEAVGNSQKGGEQVWFGGGGFKYYHLAPSLLKKDHYGNWVIDETYNADMLAAAMAKQEGFRYQPDEEIYWKQGCSTEKDLIFTTTSFVTTAMLDKIAEELQADESLLVCCKSFQQACEQAHPNITIKKIPKMLLGRCEFGKEDYSLNIINLPSLDSSSDIDGIDDTEDFSPDEGATTVSRNGKSKKSNPDQSRLQLSFLPE